MNGLLIENINGEKINTWGMYYSSNGKFYTIFTLKEKDELGYILLNISKVLKEVTNGPDGVTVTDNYVGVEITDPTEWEMVKTDIGNVVSDKQNNTKSNIEYLSTKEIEGIKIKSSKVFKLREDVINNMMDTIPEEPLPTPVPLDDITNTEEPISEQLVEQKPYDMVQELADETPEESQNQTVEPEISEKPVEEPVKQEVINTGLVDYEQRYLEEVARRQQLEEEVEILKNKINNIKSIIE